MCLSLCGALKPMAVAAVALAAACWCLAAPGGGDAAPAGGAATGLVYDDVYLKHDTGPDHPERPERLTAIVAELKREGLYERLRLIKPRRPELRWLELIHSPGYIAEVQRACREGVPYMHSLDTPICRESYDVALMAVGGVLAAVDAVVAGEVANAFCAIRPPGHHALRDRAMGFCLFNNVAIAARYAQQKHGLKRVLIVDWDVHHGNGTQAAFYDDPTVLYFSTHRYPYYPGTGSRSETGEGEGKGFTLNVPLPAGSDDRAFVRAFEEVLRPAALKFRPDIILISAGFDAHRDDPLGGMKMTADGYGELTRIVKDIAQRTCRGRVVSVLEGGYDLQALGRCVAAHIRELMK